MHLDLHERFRTPGRGLCASRGAHSAFLPDGHGFLESRQAVHTAMSVAMFSELLLHPHVQANHVYIGQNLPLDLEESMFFSTPPRLLGTMPSGLCGRLV